MTGGLTGLIEPSASRAEARREFAVVVVRNSNVTRYFSRPGNREAVEPELQAQVEFGWQNSRGEEAGDVIKNVKVFLEHGPTWRDNGELCIAELGQDAKKVEALAAEALGASAAAEVKGRNLAYRGEWLAASERLLEATRLAGVRGESPPQ